MAGYQAHDPNLRNLYWALQYSPEGYAEMRVITRNDTSSSPLHVLVDNTQQIPVTLERFDGKWKSVGKTNTDINGGYSFDVTAAREPFIKLRVTANGGSSAAVTISVL